MTINRRTLATRSRSRKTPPPTVSLEPATTYEAVTRSMVDSLADDLFEIKSRVNSIFYIVMGSILVDVVGRRLTQ